MCFKVLSFFDSLDHELPFLYQTQQRHDPTSLEGSAPVHMPFQIMTTRVGSTDIKMDPTAFPQPRTPAGASNVGKLIPRPAFPPIVLSLGHVPKTEHQKQPQEEKQRRFSHLQVTCLLKERKNHWQGRCGATQLAQSSWLVFRSQLFKMLMSFKCHLLPLVSPLEPPCRSRSQSLGQPWIPARTGAALYLSGQIEWMA